MIPRLIIRIVLLLAIAFCAPAQDRAAQPPIVGTRTAEPPAGLISREIAKPLIDPRQIMSAMACSIKGNVKRNISPTTGRGREFLDFQPLCTGRHVLRWYRPHLFAFRHGFL